MAINKTDLGNLIQQYREEMANGSITVTLPNGDAHTVTDCYAPGADSHAIAQAVVEHLIAELAVTEVCHPDIPEGGP
jgi:hypothetical protein